MFVSSFVDDDNCWLETSTAELEHNSFGIFPNLAKTEIFVVGKKTIENIEVFDAAGRHVLTTNASQTIDVSALLSGVYYLKNYTSDGLISKSFIKY